MKKKIIFLDRDGVINQYPGHFKYVSSLKLFKFLPGAKEAIVQLNRAGYSLFVVSNQAGVAKGIYSQKTLDQMTEVMLKEIKAVGGAIGKVLYCIHTDEDNCDCRKPKTGLIKQALEIVGNHDVSNSFFIGDSIRDIKTGKKVGCKTILVLSGREKINNKQKWEVQPDFISENLASASKIVLDQDTR